MAFPTYQAAGAFVASATVNVAPAWPAHQAGDIGLLIIETMGYNYAPIIVNQAGWKEVPASPRGSAVKESSGSNSSSQLSVYWKRAASGAEVAPTVKFVADHIYAGIITIRGCAASGNPFTSSNGMTSGHLVSAGTIPIPGLTTITADQLIVAIGANGINNTTSNRFTGMTNADLANIAEKAEFLSGTGGGSQIVVYTGEKAAAGAIGTSTITQAVSSPNNGLQIAFTAVQQSDDATPFVANVGDIVVTTAATLSVPWPEHITGDIALLFVESDSWPVTLFTASGFVEVPDSPQGAGSPGTATAAALSIFWCRATSGAMANVVVNKPGDHIACRIMTIRGCVPTGDPWDVTAGSNNNGASSTTVTIPGDTTTVPQTLVVAAASQSTDLQNSEFSTWVNSGLDNVIERFDEGHTFSFGGGFAAAVGRKIAAGSFGSTTAVLATASHQGRLMLAMKAATTALREILADYGAFAINGQAGTIAEARLLNADKGDFVLSGQAATFAVIVAYSLPCDAGMFEIEGQALTLDKLFGRWRKRDMLPTRTWRYQDKES